MRLLYIFVTLSLVVLPLFLIGGDASAYVDNGGSRCSYPCDEPSFKNEEGPPDENFDSGWGETAEEAERNRQAYRDALLNEDDPLGWYASEEKGCKYRVSGMGLSRRCD